MSYSKTFRLTCLALGLTAGVALAHSGVQNPAVMARMVNMSSIADQMKVLGAMAKGQSDFELSTAQTALKEISLLSGATQSHFAAPETDPKSEARPEIWTSFEDFTKRSKDLEALALGLAGSVTNLETLRAGMGQLAASCKACHSQYRD